MGEVRIKVRLTNAVDDGLARRGQPPKGGIRALEADAMVDTGAVTCVLPPFVADTLGLDQDIRGNPVEPRQEEDDDQI